MSARRREHAEIMFSRVSIFGVGLIGGSLGLAVKRARLAREVVGVGRREESLRRALEIGAVDRVTTDPAEGFKGAGLICLCAPVGAVISLLETGLPFLSRPALITDACSTKAVVSAAAGAHLPGHLSFVGAHPITGSERSGPQASDVDLFRGRVTILTPEPDADPGAVETVGEFWRAVGSRLVILSPEDHDRTLALTSHLPHLAAAMITLLVARLPARERARCIGRGFLDTTRIAGGDPSLWAGIFETNASNMQRCLGELSALIEHWRKLLADGDGSGMRALLQKAVEVQQSLRPDDESRREDRGCKQDRC